MSIERGIEDRTSEEPFLHDPTVEKCDEVVESRAKSEQIEPHNTQCHCRKDPCHSQGTRLCDTGNAHPDEDHCDQGPYPEEAEADAPQRSAGYRGVRSR